MNIIDWIKNIIRAVYPATKLNAEKTNNIIQLGLKNITPMPMLHFAIHLTEHCNLNCCGCSHFSCLHGEPDFLNIEEFEKDFKRLSELFHGEAEYIHLMGGEPLLHPRINDFLPIARKYFPHTKLLIITNGLLLAKMPDSFWDACRNNNILIVPSQYPIGLDYFKLQKMAESKDVRLLLTWHSEKLRKDTLDLDGMHDAVRNFLSCWHPNTCTLFSHGRFCTCNMPLNIESFNRKFKTDLHLSSKDYIDIYQAQSGQEILDFLAKPIPFCRYCAQEKWQTGLKWKKTNQRIEEWI